MVDAQVTDSSSPSSLRLGLARPPRASCAACTASIIFTSSAARSSQPAADSFRITASAATAATPRMSLTGPVRAARGSARRTWADLDE